MNSINKKVNNSKGFDRAALNAAQARLNEMKLKLIEDFDQHPVTREMESGPQGANHSGTLGGYGNLFSFMGFGEGSDPVEAVRNFLKSFISLKAGKGKSRGSVKEYMVKVPSLSDFDFAKMPWESGNNWVRAVETGMSSFSYYMHKAHEASRAGTGIQIDNKLRGKGSSSRPYMTELLNKFRKRLAK
jgi:hypothetical protein